MAGDPIRPEIVKWTGPREALRPDQITAAPILDDGELLDRLLVIVRDAETRLEELATAETTEVFRWLRAEVGALLVARANGQPRRAGWGPPTPLVDAILDEVRHSRVQP